MNPEDILYLQQLFMSAPEHLDNFEKCIYVADIIKEDPDYFGQGTPLNVSIP